MTSRTLGSILRPPENAWRRLRRLAVSAPVLLGSAAYVWTHNPSLFRPVAAPETAQVDAATQVAVAAGAPSAVTVASTPVSANTPADEPAPPVAEPEQPHRPYHDGEFRGKNAYAYFGDVMVSAVIENGRLAEVKVLRYPNDRKISDDISSPALVALRQQALQRQTAKVDVVSGATLTSQAYAESLKAALNFSARN